MVKQTPIEKITEIRTRNNLLWMDIVALALKAAPKEAKRILKGIQKNDKAVSRQLSKI